MLLAYTTAAQTPFTCGTDEVTRQRMETDLAYRNFVLNAKAVRTTDKAANDTILTIPVVFVVCHLGEPVGTGSNVSDADLQAQVDLMNQFYAASTIRYARGGVDSRIRFALAKRTSNCVLFNGVFRVDGRPVPGYQAAGVDYSDSFTQAKMRDLAGTAVNQIGQAAVIIRVYWQVTGAAGWASFGEDISMGLEYLKRLDAYNDVLAHEMGHVLFLAHTFETGGQTDSNGYPRNVNPLQDGDQVADTPPHRLFEPANLYSPASQTVINPCTGTPFGQIVSNIMNYTYCPYLFTAGQVARMRGYLAGSLSRFVNSPYLFPIDPSNAVIAVSCQPISGSVVTSSFIHGEGISRIRFRGIDSQTQFVSYGQALLSQDFSCFQQAVAKADQSYTINIEAPCNNIYRRVYIDWNNDGSFNETNELAFGTAIGAETGAINIPASVPANIQQYLLACKKRRFTGRYIGSLVADFHRNLIKGGIYLYPPTAKSPSGKLRLLYECYPMAFIAEQAGGHASDGQQCVLDIAPESIHQRSVLYIGSTDMVRGLLAEGVVAHIHS